MFPSPAIAYLSKRPHMEMFEGEIEADESYFGGTHKGKRGGAVGKTAVFGLLKRDGKVYTVVVPNNNSQHFYRLFDKR